MIASGKNDDPDAVPPPGPVAAARMLCNADSVSARVEDGLDLRAEAMLQRLTPAVLFAYIATFMLLFTHQTEPFHNGWPITGPLYANILMIPLLTQLTLIQGARNRLAIASTLTLSGRKLVFVFLGIAAFVAMVVAAYLGMVIPWWMCLIAAAAAALPSTLTAVAAGRDARARVPVRSVLPAPSAPNLRVRAMTLGLGVYFGFAAFSTVQSWFPIAAFALVIGLLVLVLFPNASWGLANLGS